MHGRCNIEDFAIHVTATGGNDRVNDITDKCEIAGLLAISHDRERFICQQLREKHTKNGAVTSRGACSWTVDIKKAQCDSTGNL